jgi:hypothetical protein
LDVLVVTDDDVESPRRESVRLRNSVSDINMPMDILVVPYSRFEALRARCDDGGGSCGFPDLEPADIQQALEYAA